MWIHEAFSNEVEEVIKKYFDTEKSCIDERVTGSKDYGKDNRLCCKRSRIKKTKVFQEVILNIVPKF